jgi:hypothetical protein
MPYVSVAEQTPPAFPVQHIHHTAEKGRFAGAVRSEHRQYLTRPYLKTYIPQYLPSAFVPEAAFFSCKYSIV